MRYSSVLPSFLLCSFASAQLVSPSFFTNAEAPGSNAFPFGSGAPFRYIQVHDDVTVARVVNGLGFRPNNMSTGTIVAAHTITCDVYLSTAVTTSLTIVGAFDSNHGTDKKQVITNKTLNMPANNPADVPSKFILLYPFDNPFVFPATGSLAWEAQVTAKTAASFQIDGPGAVSANPAMQYGRSGAGCLATGRTTGMTLAGLSSMSWSTNTGTMTMTISNGPASASFFHVVGFDKTNWSGLPLPYVLPGSGTAPSGPCTIYTDVLFYLSGTLTTAGGGSSPVSVPAFPYLHGLAVYNQVYALDATANPGWGFVTSTLMTAGFCAPTPAALFQRVYLSGALTATGSVGTAAAPGIVTQFN